MADDELTERLELDVGPALASADQVGARLEEVAAAAGTAFQTALAEGITTALATLDLGPLQLDVPVGLLNLDETRTELLDLGDNLTPLDLTVDYTGVLDAKDIVADLADSAIGVSDTPINLQVDDSQVTDATAAVGDLVAAEQEASAGVDIPVTGADGLDQTTARANRVTQSSGAADAAVGGLAARVQGLGPSGIAGAAGIAAVGFGIDEFVKAGQRSLEGTLRLNRAFGEEAEAVQKIDVGGLDTDLKSLAISTGSSAAGLKIAVSNFAELGKATGATDHEVVAAGKNYLALANYIAATRPELGGAEEVTQKLGTALRTGGRAALALGLPLNSAKEIAAAAAEKFGVAEGSLSTFQKQSAALDLVMERLGPSFKANLDDGLKSPIVQLRAVETQLKAVIAEAGREVTPKFIEALQDAEPVVNSLVKSFGGIAIGGVDALSGGLSAIGPLLSGVGSLISAIPPDVLRIGGAFGVAAVSAGPLLKVVTSLSSGLGRLASLAGLDSLSTSFDRFGTTTGSAARQLATLEATSTKARSTQVALAAGMEAVNTATAEGATLQQAYASKTLASGAAQSAATKLSEADVAVHKARQAVLEGEVGASADLDAALAVQSEAQVAVATTSEASTVAQTRFVVALQAAAAAGDEGAIALLGLSEAEQAAAVAAAEAAGAFEAESIALGPIAVALAVVAAGVLLFTQTSHDNEEAVKSAASTYKDYAATLTETNEALAKVPDPELRARFLAASESAKKFTDVLSDQGNLDGFNRLKLNAVDAGRAIDGDTAAARRLVAALVAAGEITFVDSHGAELRGKDLQEVQEAYVKATLAGTNFGQEIAKVDRSLAGSKAIQRPVAGEFEEEARGAAAARDALVKKVDAQARAGKITDLDSVRQAAAQGLLGKLTDSREKEIRALLGQADAQQKATATSDVLTDAIRNAATPAQKEQLEAVQRVQAALTSGRTPTAADLGSVAALAAGSAYDTLNDDVKGIVDPIAKAGQAAHDTAIANGELIDANGRLTTSFDDIAAATDTAVSKYLELAGATRGLAKAGRDAENASNDVVAAIDANGTSIDDTSGSFDAGTISVSNYSDTLSKLPKDVQLKINAIGGDGGEVDKSTTAKISAVQAAWGKLVQLQRVPVDLKIETLNAANVDDFISKLPKDVADKIKIETKFAAPKKQDVDAAKAAATRAYAQTHPDLPALKSAADDEAAAVVDAFDSGAEKIQQFAGEQLKAGVAVDQVKAKIREQRDEFVKPVIQAFVDKGDSLKVATDKVNLLLIREHLLDPQIDQDFKASGLETIGNQLEKMNLLLLTIAGVIDQKTLAEILSIPDANKQTEALQRALDAVTDPDKKAIVTAVLNSDPATSALDALTAKPYTVTIDAVIGEVPDFRSLLNGTAGQPGQPTSPAPSATPASTPSASGLFGRALHPGGASVQAAPVVVGPTPAQQSNAASTQQQEVFGLRSVGRNTDADVIAAMSVQEFANWKRLNNEPLPGFKKGGKVKKDEPVVVGEERPEVFVPDVPGTIVPSVPAYAEQRRSVLQPEIDVKPNFDFGPVPDFSIPHTPLDMSLPASLIEPSLTASLTAPAALRAVAAPSGPQELRLAAVEGLLGDLLSELRGSGQALASMSSQRSRGDTTITTHIAQIVAPSPAEVGNAVSRRQGIEARKKATA